MSDFDCEVREQPAPTPGCACRPCVRARERSLDPRIIVLLRQAWHPTRLTLSPARDILRRAVDGYLAGRIEWGSLYPTIIEALVQQSDEMFQKTLDLSNLQPRQIVIMNKEPGT